MKKILFACAVMFLASCTKSEGEGGNSSISGKVNLTFYNATFTSPQYETPAADYDVYIIYGEDTSFSDKTTTDFEGDYEFKYLRPGDYTVYVYSKVDTFDAVNGIAPDEEALIQEVTLTKNEEMVLETFEAKDN